MDSILKKLEREEKEAEKLLYGDQDTGEEVKDAEPDGESENALEAEAPDGNDDQPAGESKKRTDWKNRFTRYKASTDLTINQLRTERAQLVSETDELKKRMSEMMTKIQALEAQQADLVDPTDGIISPEQEELLGSEAVAVLKNIAKGMLNQAKEGQKPEVDSLKRQLAELQQKREEDTRRTAQMEEQQQMQDFKKRLVKAVPDFDSIDTDVKFGEYLEEVDEASGLPRLHLYKTAIQGRDVLGVARFYNDFRGTRPKRKEEILEEAITPEGNAADVTGNLDIKGQPKKRFHISDYEAFMDDQTKGMYRGREKEAKQKEMMFDKAFVEGRIDY